MRILCFGDSNTYGYDPRSFLGGQYDEPWPELLAWETGHTVLNAGQNGRCIPHTPWQLHQLDTILGCFGSFDLMTVMLGGNDLLQNRDFGAKDVAERMEVLLRHLLERPSSLLLIAPPPMRRGAWVEEERLLRESEALCEAYEALARRLEIPFADSRAWGVEVVFDGVHFSQEGHRAFAEGIKYLI